MSDDVATSTVGVTGHGSVRVAPDVAVVRVAATHAGADLAQALSGAESARAQVVEVARAHLDAAAISSTDLAVWPGHDEHGRPHGFEARHALTLRCPDLATAGTLVTALAAQVGSRLQVEGVSLELAAPDAAQDAAREFAFADARRRAAHLAALAGREVGEVLAVSEGGTPVTPVGRGGDTVRLAAASVELQPGTTAVEAAVAVVFALR